MRRKAVEWIGIDIPQSDLSIARQDGHYDVVNGTDGWVVYTPHARYAFDGKCWVKGTITAPARGIIGAVSRDDARKFAETLFTSKEIV